MLGNVVEETVDVVEGEVVVVIVLGAVAVIAGIVMVVAEVEAEFVDAGRIELSVNNSVNICATTDGCNVPRTPVPPPLPTIGL